MLNDAVGFEKILLLGMQTWRGIDGLASTIKFQFDLDPFLTYLILVLRKTHRSNQRARLGRRWI